MIYFVIVGASSLLAGVGIGFAVGLAVWKKTCGKETVTVTKTVERAKRAFTNEDIAAMFKKTGIKSDVDFLQCYAVGFNDGVKNC